MIRVFSSYYPEPNDNRRIEIQECLQKNLANPAIDSVHLFLERIDSTVFKHDKLKTKKIDRRPTYNDFFEWAREIQPSTFDLTVFTNSDIYFDGSLGALNHGLKENQSAALSRWDINSSGDPALFDRKDSQDVWIFKGPIRKIQGGFCVGIPRCDNRILYELKKAGYEVINPAFSIRSYHLHEGVREEYQDENLEQFVERPYAYLWPHNLWSLPRTLLHNIQYPDARVSWRFDRRKLSGSIPMRVFRRVFASFSSRPDKDNQSN